VEGFLDWLGASENHYNLICDVPLLKRGQKSAAAPNGEKDYLSALPY